MYNLIQLGIVFCVTASICNATTITQSADRLILGNDHTFTCIIDGAYYGILFIVNGLEICAFDKCKLNGCNNNFRYTCDIDTRNFTLTIPGSFTNNSYHHSAWQCIEVISGKSNIVFLYITVPVSSVEIAPSITDISVGNSQTFTCKTSAGRPNAIIKWYLSDGTNLTASATQQPDCGQCINRIESISNVTYYGKLNDHGKFIFCAASNVEGKTERSQNVTIRILYGPFAVVLSPLTPSYTVSETTGSIGPITCAADCRPKCTMVWRGPNLPGGMTSVLNLHNINRNQTGDYQCAASNSVGSLASGKVTIIVKYGPSYVLFSPFTSSYTVNETSGSIGPITCTADCRPNCTIAWSGPNLSGVITSILTLQNIKRNQTGSYQCTANNSVNSLTSGKITVKVNYGPSSVVLSPSTQTYTVTESTDSIGPIKCTADCRPNCAIAWNGPNLPGGAASVLNIQNISRIQSGDYQCTATNIIGSKTSGSVAVIVNYIPTILSVEGNTTYYGNDTAEFRCLIDSFPESLIQWTFIDGNIITIISKDNKSFYKVNGNVLNVYLMSCLSMGLYRCEADNGIERTEKSVYVSVMCSPRLNTIEYDISVRIAVRESESLNITVPILAYPMPWLYWQFQKNQYSINLTNEVTNRHYINRHTSSLFIHNMEEDNFGTYNIYGGNGIDNTNYQIGSFYIVGPRRPDMPTNVVAVCKSSLLIIIWRSGFNGGDTQIFTVEMTKSATGDKILSDKIIDPGYNKYIQFSSDALTADSNYDIIVKSTNIYGQSNSTTYVTCKSTGNRSSSSDALPSSRFPVGFGTGFGVATIIFIVIVVIIAFIRIKRKRNSRPATSKLYEETRGITEPANIYNELNQITKDGKNELITRRNKTDTPNMYDDVMAYDNQVIKSEDQRRQTKGSTSTKIGGGIYMNTEI